MEIDNERVIVNMTMVKIGDKVLELEELNKLQGEQIDELKQLMADWAEVLNPAPTECGWQGDLMVHSLSCACDEDNRQDELE